MSSGKVPSGWWSRAIYEPWAELACIHSNPETSNLQALSHWPSQWRYLPRWPHSYTYHHQLKGRGEGAKAHCTQSKLYVLTQPVSKTCNCKPTVSEFLDSMKEVCTWTTLLQNSSDVRKDTSSGNVAQSPLSKEYQSSDGISREVGRSEYSALSPVANTWNVTKWEHSLLATIHISPSWNLTADPPM